MNGAMTPSQIVERKLKRAPYIAFLAAIATAVLGIWAPFYPWILVLAIAVGVAAVLTQWRKVRSPRRTLILDGSFPVILASPFAIWPGLDGSLGYSALALLIAQYSALAIFTATAIYAMRAPNVLPDNTAG